MDPFASAQPLHDESRNFINAVQERYEQMATIEEARESCCASSKFGAVDVDFAGRRDEYFIPSAEVKNGVPAYVYVPEKVEANPPIVVYYHGGGNVVGERVNVESTCKILAKGAKCIYVNVEYRLAPEHKFPAGLNDACDVAKWVLENRKKIGGGPQSKVGVSGDSAGGQLAASVAHDVPGVSFQILIYPHVSARGDRSLPSFQEYKNGPILQHELMDWFENLMSDVSEWRNPRFANLLRDRFDYLPPCLFIVAQCDPLRDDSYEYAKKLTKVGVYNELHLAEGAIHAFYTLPAIFPKLCEAAYDRTIEFIKKWGTTESSKI